MSELKIGVVVVAAGRGIRAGGGIPKQYRTVGGQPVIRMAVEALLADRSVSVVQPVVNPDDAGMYGPALDGLPVRTPVSGGATRQVSVLRGLEALAAFAPDIVLIHDAARPFVSARIVADAIAAVGTQGGAVPAMPVTDAVKAVDAHGRVTGDVDRTPLRLVQTPQAFAFGPLLDAHRRAATVGRDDFPDDAALASWAGMAVNVFQGDARNIKLTTEDDFVRAERMRAAPLTDLRVGSGFDVHVFGPGDHVVLGGVRIPHDRGLEGHSDADVVLHALTDAVLGSIADGDIGTHFPPSDMQWRGASSDQFLAFAVERVRARGGVISLLDITVLSEAPRIGPHREAIRTRVAEIAGISVSRVGIKATTMEQMGFVGRREGMAAMATATVRLPEGGDD